MLTCSHCLALVGRYLDGDSGFGGLNWQARYIAGTSGENRVLKNHLRQMKTMRLGELLVKKGVISSFVLEAAIATQSQTQQKLGEILIAQGHITPRQLRKVLREQRVLKVLASVVLTSGVGAATLPKLLESNVDLQLASLQGKNKKSAVGNGQLKLGSNSQAPSTTNAPYKVSRQRLPDFMKVSLVSNPKPTVAQPLIGFCHPLNGRGWLSQGNNAITHRGRSAYAYDLAAPIGTPIYAMRGGRVVGLQDKYPDTGGGRSRYSKFNYVWIEHDAGYRSAYLHMQQNFLDAVPLRKGTYVEAGQLIGFSGNSGFSTGPHLHIEVQRPGRRSGFNKTVPFEVSGRCQAPSLANQEQGNPG